MTASGDNRPGTEPDTLPRLMADAARRFGDAVAVTEGALNLSWNELDALRVRAARALVACGIDRGDMVAIWAPNVHEWIVAAMGVQTIGAILVPLNTRLKPSEAAALLRRSGTRLVFTLSGFLGNDYADWIRNEDIPSLEQVVTFRGDGRDAMDWDSFLALADEAPGDEVERLAASVSPDDVMDLMFTSGTTGLPKAAMQTHGQNITCHRRYAEIWGLRGADSYVIVPPFFHTFGYKSGWLACLTTGTRILPAMTFDPDALMPLIERERISVLTGPPTVFHAMLSHPRRAAFDLGSLRLAFTGAATVPVSLIRRMYSELRLEIVVVAYGMTECCGYVACTRPGDDPETVATTVGRPLPLVEMRIADGEGSDLEQGETGEVLLRGPMVMKGYFDDPEATAEAIDADGWFHTGDIGHVGADGNLRITDRLKDMIITGGFNTYPAEIEKMLSEMEGVRQVAVIGVPDGRLGEVGKAFIIAASGSGLTDAGVIAWARERMANYKVPRYVEFVDALPLNASGKVLKTELRAREEAKRRP